MTLCCTVFLSFIWLSSAVSSSTWNFSMVFMSLPFLVTYNIFIISSTGPKEWLFSMRCCAKFEFLLLYLKALQCSLNLVLNDLPVFGLDFSAIWTCQFQTESKRIYNSEGTRRRRPPALKTLLNYICLQTVHGYIWNGDINKSLSRKSTSTIIYTSSQLYT